MDNRIKRSEKDIEKLHEFLANAPMDNLQRRNDENLVDENYFNHRIQIYYSKGIPARVVQIDYPSGQTEKQMFMLGYTHSLLENAIFSIDKDMIGSLDGQDYDESIDAIMAHFQGDVESARAFVKKYNDYSLTGKFDKRYGKY